MDKFHSWIRIPQYCICVVFPYLAYCVWFNHEESQTNLIPLAMISKKGCHWCHRVSSSAAADTSYWDVPIPVSLVFPRIILSCVWLQQREKKRIATKKVKETKAVDRVSCFRGRLLSSWLALRRVLWRYYYPCIRTLMEIKLWSCEEKSRFKARDRIVKEIKL